MKCTCCERTKIGVPCSCFFRIARDANIPYDKIMDVGMFDVRYTKLFNSHYASEDKTMANMIYEAQKVCIQKVYKCLHLVFVYICVLFTSISYLHPIQNFNPFTSKSYLHPFLRLHPFTIYIQFNIHIHLHPNPFYIHLQHQNPRRIASTRRILESR